MRSRYTMTLTALGLVAALIAAAAPHSRAAQGAGSKALEGSWQIKVTSVSGAVPPFDEFITFTSGGGLVEANNAFPPAAASPGHGSWAHGAGQTFNFTFYKLLFLSPDGQFTGRLRVRGTIEMQGRDAWTGTAVVDFLDPAGDVINTDLTTAQATRIAVEPQ